MNASEFFEQLERDREALLSRKSPYRTPATVVELPAKRLELDRLTRTEQAAYDTGAWLGPVVRSQQLHHNSRGAVAELSARIRVQLERQEAIG